VFVGAFGSATCLVPGPGAAHTSLLSSYKAKRLTGDLRFGKSKDPDKRKKAGQSTIKKELAFLRMIFNKAIDEWDDDWDGYFRSNPVNPVRKVIKGLKENKRVRYVMPDEAQDDA
jgi:hypothetical protein